MTPFYELGEDIIYYTHIHRHSDRNKGSQFAKCEPFSVTSEPKYSFGDKKCESINTDRATNRIVKSYI